MFPCRVIKRQCASAFFFFTWVFTNVTSVPPTRERPPTAAAVQQSNSPTIQNQGLQTSHSRVSIVSLGHLTHSIHISFVYKNKNKKTSNKNISFVDNCPLLNGPIKRQSSRPWEWVSRIQVTVRLKKKKWRRRIQKETWSRCLQVKHACVFQTLPRSAPPETLVRRRTFFCKSERKQKKATWLLLHCSVVLSVRSARAKTFKRCFSCFSPLPTPPSTLPTPPHWYCKVPTVRRKDSWRLVQLQAPEEEPPQAGFPTTHRRDLWRNSLALEEVEVLASCAE